MAVVLDITRRTREVQHRELLLNELNQRVKNSLAAAQASATRTFASATDLTSFRDAFMSRLLAPSGTHDLLVESAHRRGLPGRVGRPPQGRHEHRVPGAYRRAAILRRQPAREAVYPLVPLQEAGVPFMFASAYGKPGIPEAFSRYRVMPKPYPLNDLIPAVEGLLEMADGKADGGASPGKSTPAHPSH